MARYLIEELPGEQGLFKEEDGVFYQLGYNKKGYWQPVDISLEPKPSEPPSRVHSRVLDGEEATELLQKLDLLDD